MNQNGAFGILRVYECLVRGALIMPYIEANAKCPLGRTDLWWITDTGP